MKQIEITPSVKYVGADDTDLDLFEGQYPIPNGVSYNSYIIDDEKIALLDTVDARKTDEWLNNVDAATWSQTTHPIFRQYLRNSLIVLQYVQ